MRVVLFLAILFSYVLVHAQPDHEELASIDFYDADSVAALYPRHSLTSLKSLVDKLTQPFSTDVEKFRAIYRWICNNIANDYGLYLKVKRQRERVNDVEALKAWNADISKVVFKELLTKQKTVCSGYAYLLKEMCSLAGIGCIIIDGYGRSAQANIKGYGIPNHSWNAVKLNGKWHLCDATWSSGAVVMSEKRFIQEFNDSYFLADPSVFALNHYPLDSGWMLLDTKPTLTEFLNAPIVYNGIYKYKVDHLVPETFDVTLNAGNPFTFCFKKRSDKVIKRVELRINGVVPTYSIEHPNLHQNAEGFYYIDHIFNKKGDYVMHVLFDDSYVCSYAVKVL